jgi:hypothetical protein
VNPGASGRLAGPEGELGRLENQPPDEGPVGRPGPDASLPNRPPAEENGSSCPFVPNIDPLDPDDALVASNDALVASNVGLLASNVGRAGSTGADGSAEAGGSAAAGG